MSLGSSTYKEYLQLVAGNSPSDIKKKSALVITRFHKQSIIPSYFLPITFLVDYATQKYIYIEKTCFSMIGKPDKYYYKEGIKAFWKQTDPVDFAIINEKVFPYNINFITKIPTEKYPDYIFTHNFRMYKPSGETVMLLQRSSFVPAREGRMPAGVIGVVFDITHYKSANSIIHTIEETSIVDNKTVFNLLYKKAYPIRNNFSVISLTKRETVILKMIAKGNGSKQIAADLGISINTVNNHRKNILQKTNCKTSTALLKQAIQYELI